MGVLTASIHATIDGEKKEMQGHYELLSIDVSKEFNKIPTAELRLVEGDIAKKEFEILDGDFFALGTKIEIALRYENEANEDPIIFIGIVINQSLELNKLGTTLTVELSDEAIKMTHIRKNAVHINKTDSEIIGEMLKEAERDVITKTDVIHPQMIQYYATDWDFILLRAEANGQLVQANDGRVSVYQPEISENAKHELELGSTEIYDFDLKINGENQYDKINAIAWDSTTQAFALANEVENVAVENPATQNETEVNVITQKTLIHAAEMKSDELKAWSDAQIFKSSLSLVRGWIKVEGSSKYKVGQTISIKEASKVFTRKNSITGVRHGVTQEGWVTHLQIGMGPSWFSVQEQITDTKAAGLLPGINGLQIGIVQAEKESAEAPKKDPNLQAKVLVMIPALGTDKNSLWARLTTVDAGKGRGVFFRPEEGDEVIVGFLNDDPRQAIILGAVHSSSNDFPVDFDKENKQKGIFTKSKYQLLFDEGNEVITLATSDDNKVCIDQKNNSISLSDANKNKVTLSEDGVTIISEKNCEIKVGGNLIFEAGKNVSITGKKVDLI